ncbi:outer membrane protein assembly factor BamB [Terasakiispira papahanaumokuakeensis]|uniref:Outer membrane protein assembly factor BamB n=1 Tax=Terasakiispira papahanaumokuakeensis TaxID=197479 RepID=A0A1E2V644_9GAMM|nr:outer membrane protein assembly factor BamB [Terasakiispira papahanaumokuakeensis]ODC02322.1 outer membrane protein assembly factor BamB [Terasakiispira papahanaumokuakeensis]
MRLAPILGLTGLLWLTGCSGIPEPEYPPAPLPDDKGTVEIDQTWSDSGGFGQKWRGYQLAPALQGHHLYSVDLEGYVQAFDLKEDKALWWKTLDAGASASPAADSRLVLIPTQNGELVALDAQTGNERWRHQLSSEALSPPIIRDDQIIQYTSDGHVQALSRIDGRVRWQYDHNEPLLTLRGTSTPVVTATMTYVGFADGQLVALDNRTGQVRWRATIAVPQGRTDIERLVDIDGQPAMQGSALVATSFQGNVMALDPYSGRSRWEKKLSSYRSPVIVGREVIVIDEASRIRALSLSGGNTLWQQEGLFGRNLTSPALVNGYIVVADEEGYIHAIDPKTGEIVGQTAFDYDGVKAPPVTDGKSVIFNSVRGDLGLFELHPIRDN